MLLGCGLYYGVLMFNLAVTFWIGESLLVLTGLLIYVPITAFALLRLLNKFPAGHHSMDHAILNSDSPSTLLKRYTDSTTRS